MHTLLILYITALIEYELFHASERYLPQPAGKLQRSAKSLIICTFVHLDFAFVFFFSFSHVTKSLHATKFRLGLSYFKEISKIEL